MKNWFDRSAHVAASCALTAMGLMTSIGAVAADNDPFPNKSIRVIVPFGAGSGTDLTTRYMAQAVSDTLGWKFLVDNKPGANGFIAVQELLRSVPDGYTMMMSGNTTHAANPVLFKKLPYDPIEDFIPLARLNVAPLVLFVAPKHQIDNVGQLIDLIRKNPGKMAFATGSASHRAAAEIFKLGKQLDVVHAPYKSSPQAITDLLGGHVDFMFVDLGAGMSFIRSNQLKAVALTSLKRLDVLPSVPTMNESGFTGMEVTGWTGLFLPKKTPQPVVDTLSRAVMQYAASDAARKFATDNGSVIEVMTPVQSLAWVKSEISRYGQIYKQAGIEAE